MSPAAVDAVVTPESEHPLDPFELACDRVPPLARLKRLPLAPVTELEQSSLQTGLLLKRDDLGGTGFGGGKPRKLEFLLGEVVAAGAPGLVTFGGVGSNHAVACAHHAAQLGLGCHLLLLPQRPSALVAANLRAMQAHGATLELVGSRGQAERRARELERRGHAVLPWGGTSGLGNLGFFVAAFELDAQLADMGRECPTRIVMAGGTLGSAVGLGFGLAAAGRECSIQVVRASNWNASGPQVLKREVLAMRQYLTRLDPSLANLNPVALELEGSFLGRGYGFPTPAGERATARFTEVGIRLEATYTAKAAAALLSPGASSGGALFWSSHNAHPLPRATEPGRLPADLRGYAKTKA